jgi:hypothetical protein
MTPLFALALAASGPAHAFCGAYASSAGTDIYNSVSEVAIVRQNGRTTLTVANDVEGAAGAGFAMLVPVPEILDEDDVNVLAHDTFANLDGYTRPRMVSYTCDDFEPSWEDPCAREPLFPRMTAEASYSMDAGAMDSGMAEAPDVDVEAEFVVGEYEIVILSAEESDELFAWLFNEGYQISDATGEAVQEYLDGGAYFFAAKVAASLIQRCDYRAVRYRGQDRFPFPRLAAVGSGFPVVNFVNVQRPSYPALEMLEEIAFDAAAQAAYGDDMEAHGVIPSAMRRIHINRLGQSLGP